MRAPRARSSRPLQIDPQLLEARLHIIFIHLARGGKPNPRAEVERLLREFPNEARAHRVAATIYRLDGKHQESLRIFSRATYKMGGSAIRQVNEKLRLTMPATRFL